MINLIVKKTTLFQHSLLHLPCRFKMNDFIPCHWKYCGSIITKKTWSSCCRDWLAFFWYMYVEIRRQKDIIAVRVQFIRYDDRKIQGYLESTYIQISRNICQISIANIYDIYFLLWFIFFKSLSEFFQLF